MDIKKFRSILQVSLSRNTTIEEGLKICEAFWFFHGEPSEPHAELASRLHSDFYANLSQLFQFSNMLEWIGNLLVDEIKKKLKIRYIDAVVSSSFAGIVIGQKVAEKLGAAFVFTEKKNGRQIWTGRFELVPKTVLLQVEDLITTFRTTEMVREAVLKENPNVIFLEFNKKPVVCAAIYRPQKFTDNTNYEVISLMRREVPIWEPEICPICKKGSVALLPKKHWPKFISYMC